MYIKERGDVGIQAQCGHQGITRKHCPWLLNETVILFLSELIFHSHPSPCTVLIIMVSTFSSLMRSLCLSSALLLETCGAASHLSPTLGVVVEREGWAVAKTDQLQDLCHSVCVFCTFICLCSPSPTSSICFKREKPHVMALVATWCSSAAFSDKSLLFGQEERLMHNYTREISCTGCRAICPQSKIGSGLDYII